uniref:Programmed cell death protein 10 dimerisation domain-containing protein n=2 Tax=Haemonchus contortus TaxID=6289 RepID=W6NEZ6_HAECO
MNEEGGYLGAMTYQCLYSGILDKLRSSKKDDDRALAAIHRLRSAMRTSESVSPSFLFDFTKILLAESELNINLQEAYLRMHDTSPTDDLVVQGHEHVPEYKELTKRAIELRRVLSRVPEEMADRHQFLETIKLIASSIKKLLEAINAVHQIVPQSAQQAVEKRKREFVHYSKRFSNTLKTYFKDQNAVQVSVSANQLVFQTSLIIKTVNEKLRR